MGKYLDLVAEVVPACRAPLTRYEVNEKNEVIRFNSFNSFSSYSFDPPSVASVSLVKGTSVALVAPFTRAFEALEGCCPDHVDILCWQLAVEDGRKFLIRWGAQAERLGWTARDLFGLHQPPDKPHPSYSRLSRYDATGLIWLLRGRPVIALTENTAAIENPTGAITIYRKNNRN